MSTWPGWEDGNSTAELPQSDQPVAVFGAFTWLVIDVKGGSHCGQLGLCCIIKEAEQVEEASQ